MKLLNYIKSIDRTKIKTFITRFLAIDNLYYKFILTVIAIALCIIAYKLPSDGIC